MGLIFITAGERSVACGSAKAPNLPEWAKRLSRFYSAHSGSGCLYVSLSTGNVALACGYEGSAFQAVYNTLTFSPNGLDFHNRRRAIALPAAKNDNNRLPERQNSIAKALKFCLTGKEENDCDTANRASFVCGYENLAHWG